MPDPAPDSTLRRVTGVVFNRFTRSTAAVGLVAVLFIARESRGQVDPVDRRLLHFGYNQPVEGRSPLSVYAFYLHNQTNFLRSDWTLRAAVAPVWVDTQLGLREALGELTDLGLIAAGGGFARSYSEIRMGEWEEGESFSGHGFTFGAAAYHLFNPGGRIPLNAVLALTAEGSYFTEDSDLDPNFELPPNHVAPVLRTGLRLGGQEPDLRSPFAFEVSAWYEGRLRSEHGDYGFDNDRRLEEIQHKFWARLLGRLTSPGNRHDIDVSVTAGTGLHLDRLSAYRLGGLLPFSSEFPLMIPGYYYQELGARNFVLLSGNYSVALAQDSAWRFAVFGATSGMTYVPGMDYPGRAHSGVGGGLTWRSPRRDWIISAFYGYGFDALRDESLGGHMVGIVLQYDFLLVGGWERFLAPSQLSQDVLRLFGR